MSLLLDHGHPEATAYPLGMLMDESNLVIERQNGAIVTEANLLQMAVHGVLSKSARDSFAKSLKKLNVETRLLNDETEDPDTENGLPRLLPQGYRG